MSHHVHSIILPDTSIHIKPPQVFLRKLIHTRATFSPNLFELYCFYLKNSNLHWEPKNINLLKVIRPYDTFITTCYGQNSMNFPLVTKDAIVSHQQATLLMFSLTLLNDTCYLPFSSSTIHSVSILSLLIPQSDIY